MTPDYPFREVFWPQFIKKRPHYAENRPFQPPIACLGIIPRPEKAIFSNDAGAFRRTHRLLAVGEYQQEKTRLVTRDPEVRKAI